MVINYGYPHYMKRAPANKQPEPAAQTAKPVIEGLPAGVLSALGLEPTGGTNQGDTWLLQTERGKVCLHRKSQGIAELKKRLEWQKFVAERGGCLPLPLVDKQGEPGVVYNGSLWYGWFQPEGEGFQSREADHLRKVVAALSRIHALSGQYEQQNQLPQDFDWPLQVQARLTELLFFSRRLAERRWEDDFQRVFMENFDFTYDQGQEAVQKMVLANCTEKCRAHFLNLLGSFRPEDLLISEEKAIFCNPANLQRGPRVLDLAFFLRSYLGEHRWDFNLAKELLECYQEISPLEAPEKYLLLSIMRFPARFWLYMRQYSLGESNVPELTAKLINLVYESRLRDRCLDSLDSLLSEGE